MRATSGVTWATVMVMRISLGRVDELQNAVTVPNSSLPGLDPAIHPFHKKMDARVKPAHDP
jgi:hypothetical protein